MTKAGPTGGALLLLLGVLSAFGSGAALAADRFTSTTGSDAANDCLTSASPCRTLGHALTQAASGDTIKIAEGGYTESVATPGNTTLVVSGGWTSGFVAQGPPSTTRIRAPGAIVFDVTADGTAVDVTLQNLTLQRSQEGILAQSINGGALSVTLVDVVLRSIASFGGAIDAFAYGASTLDLAVTGSTFKRNRPGVGAIQAGATGTSSLGVSLTASTFEANNAATGSGGGVVVQQLGSGTVGVTVDDCVFRSNKVGYRPSSSTNRGGAMTLIGGPLSATIVNSRFRRNLAGIGGAISLVELGPGLLDLAIVNSSFSRNRATFRGGAIDLGDGGGTAGISLALTNTILWGNTAATGGDLDIDASSGGTYTVDADHCDIGDVSTAGTGTFNDLGGNIDADPSLTSDLHLVAGSPAIDAGTCTGAPATDFEGDTRPTGGGCDMGADEFVP